MRLCLPQAHVWLGHPVHTRVYVCVCVCVCVCMCVLGGGREIERVMEKTMPR